MCAGHILITLQLTIPEDPASTVFGLRALYNMCYRSEEAQSRINDTEVVSTSPLGEQIVINIRKILEMVRFNSCSMSVCQFSVCLLFLLSLLILYNYAYSIPLNNDRIQVRESSIWTEMDVQREHRRLQLALQPGGWRGAVEEQMSVGWQHESI